MSNTLPAEQKMYDVSYDFEYRGNVTHYREQITETKLANIQQLVDRGYHEDSVIYSNLHIYGDLGYTNYSNLPTWYKIGCGNHWIARAYDTEFSYESFSECKTLDYLVEKLRFGNWSLGQAFYYKNICFINQVSGGDEWLVIRDDIAFESWSCGYVIKKNVNHFLNTLERMMNATRDQLRNGRYMDAGKVVHCNQCGTQIYLGARKSYVYKGKDTCERCWTSRKFYLDNIVSKVRDEVKVTLEDIEYLQYGDYFHYADVEGHLIHLDDNLAIGIEDISNGKMILIHRPLRGRWRVSSKYELI